MKRLLFVMASALALAIPAGVAGASGVNPGGALVTHNTCGSEAAYGYGAVCPVGVPATTPVTAPFGAGATGWDGSPAVSGVLVLPASAGIVVNGFDYNLYEPIGSSFADEVGWTIPAWAGQAGVARMVAAWTADNPGWVPGEVLVVPNVAGEPTI